MATKLKRDLNKAVFTNRTPSLTQEVRAGVVSVIRSTAAKLASFDALTYATIVAIVVESARHDGIVRTLVSAAAKRIRPGPPPAPGIIKRISRSFGKTVSVLVSILITVGLLAGAWFLLSRLLQYAIDQLPPVDKPEKAPTIHYVTELKTEHGEVTYNPLPKYKSGIEIKQQEVKQSEPTFHIIQKRSIHIDTVIESFTVNESFNFQDVRTLNIDHVRILNLQLQHQLTPQGTDRANFNHFFQNLFHAHTIQTLLPPLPSTETTLSINYDYWEPINTAQVPYAYAAILINYMYSHPQITVKAFLPVTNANQQSYYKLTEIQFPSTMLFFARQQFLRKLEGFDYVIQVMYNPDVMHQYLLNSYFRGIQEHFNDAQSTLTKIYNGIQQSHPHQGNTDQITQNLLKALEWYHVNRYYVLAFTYSFSVEQKQAGSQEFQKNEEDSRTIFNNYLLAAIYEFRYLLR